MTALDFPDLGLLAPNRTFSASPLQSLALMNNPFVLHQSQSTSERLQREHSVLEDQIRQLLELAYQRPPRDTELGALKAYATEHGLAALCRIVFNSNEFLFIP
jgi:hypothetical protein